MKKRLFFSKQLIYVQKKSQLLPKSNPLLTRGMRQGGEERLEATSKPLHALMKVGQGFQVTYITEDLILWD